MTAIMITSSLFPNSMDRTGITLRHRRPTRRSGRLGLQTGFLGVLFLIGSLALGAGQSAGDLTAEWDTENGWVRFQTSYQPDTLISLEASSSLTPSAWTPIALTHDGLDRYPDLTSARWPHRFYRINRSPRPPGHDWKNQVQFPDDAFLSAETEGGRMRWVKFSILLNDPTRVLYQHSRLFPFHYDFLTRRVDAFRGLDRAAFDRISLFREGQQVVLGAVLYPPDWKAREYGIQLVGQDSYPPEQALEWLELVRATLHPESSAVAFYVPSFEQRTAAESHRQHFVSRGFEIASVERWVEQDHCYASGWAVGKLKFFPASEIDIAYADGRLGPSDLLLTDGVPAETPLVAGIISLSPSTPNSHTAILASSFGIPFVYLPEASERDRVRSLVDQEVLLSAHSEGGRCEVRVLSLEGKLSADHRAELLALKAFEPLDFKPKERYGQFSASTAALKPADIRFFGGKAANYGLLRQSIPNHSPAAIAFSFDLWDVFMDQLLPSQQTLRQEIQGRLGQFTEYPPNLPSLKSNLAAIRSLIRNEARFAPEQQTSITHALSVFNPGKKIRFRSSTNVEDSENFTGAGLYDSYSGCLSDDLDADSQGPSQCDGTWSTERGVFRALQQVYASFYNDNAFLERLRHRVDESKVAMGVLVHHSFPDEEEMANGVASLHFEFSPFSTNVFGNLVSQIGAFPVTNPDGDSIPEVVNVSRFSSFSSVLLRQSSSKVPLGATVMNWDADYQGFLNLFLSVGLQYRQTFPAKTSFSLDFEYKKDTNRTLIVKQVRPLPLPDSSRAHDTYLVDEPTVYQVGQEEFGDVFSNHRLKSIWHLSTTNTSLVPQRASVPIYRDGSVEYLENQSKQTLIGPPSVWPAASHSFDANNSLSIDKWTTGVGVDQRRWQLTTELTLKVFGSHPPVLTQQEFPTHVWVAYAMGKPTMDYEGKFTTTTQEVVRLRPIAPLLPNAIRRAPVFVATNAARDRVLQVQPVYYWPKPPTGVAAGYTAPLVRFEQTQIVGLTSQPLVLRDYYSQTYRPGHHNFSEEFLFEPGLDPQVSPALLDELRKDNIQLVHLHWRGGEEVECTILGWDGKFRRF
jgi:hypothetical protein